MDKERLVVIDGNMIVHRAYHALPPLRMKGGDMANAVYGFLLVFFRIISEFKPSYVAATFDNPKPTFRHIAFKDYKSKRPPTPHDLSSQIPKIKNILNEFGITFFEKEGFEADDLMGTISVEACQQFNNNRISSNTLFDYPEDSEASEVVIFSGDLDTLQLINHNVKVCSLNRGLKDIFIYNEDKVKERYGVSPEQFIDFKALKGDSSDNIPGVAGIGDKTAKLLIQGFSDLENLYNELEANSEKSIKIIRPLVKDKLVQGKANAFFSKKLSTIKKDVPIDFDLADCSFKNYDKEKASFALKRVGFVSLLNKLPAF